MEKRLGNHKFARHPHFKVWWGSILTTIHLVLSYLRKILSNYGWPITSAEIQINQSAFDTNTCSRQAITNHNTRRNSNEPITAFETITCSRQKARVNERESVTICLRFNPDSLRKMCAIFSANLKVWQCKNKGNIVLLPSCWYMELRVRAGSTWMGLTSRVTWTGTSSVWRWDLTNSSSARRDTGRIINNSSSVKRYRYKQVLIPNKGRFFFFCCCCSGCSSCSPVGRTSFPVVSRISNRLRPRLYGETLSLVEESP